MKSFGALILAVLLSGCAAAAAPEPQPAPTAPISPPLTLSPLQTPLTEGSGGVLRAYSLENTNLSGLWSWKDGLLLRTREGTRETLVYIPASGPEASAEASLPSGARLQIQEELLSYFDPRQRQTVVLTQALEELRRIDGPEELTGTPLLSPEGDTLYYCTQDSVRALELSTGISRVVKSGIAGLTGLQGLLLEGTVIQAGYYDAHWGEGILFLSAQTGATLADRGSGLQIASFGQQYCATFPNGAAPSLVFGRHGEAAMALYPREHQANWVCLPRHQEALSWYHQGEETWLERYDLASGRRASCLALKGSAALSWACSGAEGRIWFLLSDSPGVLYCWDAASSPVRDDHIYTGLHYTRDAPDQEGLAQCRAYALELELRYGLPILLGEETLAAQSREYDLETEYRADLIRMGLEQLEAWLDRFPEGFLPELSQSGQPLHICLVRRIHGTPESGDTSIIPSALSRRDGNAYLILPLGDGMEGAFYRQISRAADTLVLTRSSAYDQWDKLNPRDFTYDYSYRLYGERREHPYLREEARGFVNSYSMTYPSEDRAGIFEMAMLPGNETLFQAPILQRKLLTVCNGLRAAFGLEDYPSMLPWEQYLLTPLTPTA